MKRWTRRLYALLSVCAVLGFWASLYDAFRCLWPVKLPISETRWVSTTADG